jgi:hypothetical protein
MKTLTTLILIVFLSGCATQAKYHRAVKSWTGLDASELIHAWGYPDATIQAPNGNTVYIYGKSNSVTLPSQTSVTGSATPWGSFSGSAITTGGQTVNYACNTYFEINNNDAIVSVSYKGNGCVSW